MSFQWDWEFWVFSEIESSEFQWGWVFWIFSKIECSEFSVRLRVLIFQWDWVFWILSEIESSEFSVRLSVLSFQWDWVSWISPLDGVVQHWAVCVVWVHVHVLVDPPTQTQHVWTGVVCLSDGLQPKCVMLLYIAWTGVVCLSDGLQPKCVMLLYIAWTRVVCLMACNQNVSCYYI